MLFAKSLVQLREELPDFLAGAFDLNLRLFYSVAQGR